MDNLIQFDTTSIIPFIYIIRGERVLLDKGFSNAVWCGDKNA
jgi:hypothetical protein